MKSIPELLACTLVSRHWRQCILLSDLWRQLYQVSNPFISSKQRWRLMSVDNEKRKNNLTTNWYVEYKERSIADRYFQVLCVDLGHHQLKYDLRGGHLKFDGAIDRFSFFCLIQVWWQVAVDIIGVPPVDFILILWDHKSLILILDLMSTAQRDWWKKAKLMRHALVLPSNGFTCEDLHVLSTRQNIRFSLPNLFGWKV